MQRIYLFSPPCTKDSVSHRSRRWPAGVPVIASDATSLPEVIGDAGLLISPDDEQGFAQAIARLLTEQDTTERNTLVARGLEQARKFSWDVSARQTLDVYERVLQEIRYDG